MIKVVTPKPVHADYWKDRLSRARGFLKLAKIGIDFRDPGDETDVYRANKILSAIAYVDTITTAVAQVKNQKDHQAAVKLLRKVLGNELPNGIESKLNSIISRKDDVEYGAKTGKLDEAERMMHDMTAIADWAEAEMAKRFPGVVNTIEPDMSPAENDD